MEELEHEPDSESGKSSPLVVDQYSSSSDEESENEEENTGEYIEPYPSRRRPGHAFWGFEVQKYLDAADIPKDNDKRLSRFKLLLDSSKSTSSVRQNLQPILRQLKRNKHINKDEDIFAHYLTRLLGHTKKQLAESNDWADDMNVEFVLCIPAKWPPKGCRVMQGAMETAVRAVGFGERAIDSVYKLFIISEPEAAAACILAEEGNNIFPGETIVILDAGGGTLDVVTYQVTNNDPLRLSAEIVPPDSKLDGSSYINERFENLLKSKLRNEKYLETNGKTIQSIVESRTIEFENLQKRLVDTTSKNAILPPIKMDNLRPGKTGFFQNKLQLTSKETRHIFRTSLRAAKLVLKGQIELAADAQYRVQKVILTGGFANSRGLQNYLRKYVEEQKNIADNDIQLLISPTPSTAVVRGAVLRALDKSFGPSRITQCSYGCLRSEPYEPKQCPAHEGVRCRIGDVDGEKWVDNTIHWLIQKNQTVAHQQEFSLIQQHTFKMNKKRLICEEVLFVSDEMHKSHYRKSHKLNKAAEEAGRILADMTFLRDQGLIQPTMPSESSTNFGSNKPYWVVEFELVLIVEGRSLRYEARWPLKSALQDNERQRVQVDGQVCIAAAFKAGTA